LIAARLKRCCDAQSRLFEAKQKLSELVERASRGERIGSPEGKLAAEIVPREKKWMSKNLRGMERIRKRAKPCGCDNQGFD